MANNIYDWGSVKEYLKNHGVRETIRYFGMSKRSFQKAVERGVIANKPIVFDVSKHFVPGKARHALKRGLKVLGISYECAVTECKASTWLGKPLSLQLDHIDGNKKNNDPSNLRLLCPNCHSQTKTFAGRNTARFKAKLIRE